MTKTILFVEDDPVVTRIYSRKIEEGGFKVVVAPDGIAALKELSLAAPELVVLDILMPKLNGVDVLKFLRSRPELAFVPVVVFSNALLTELGDQITKMGAQAIIPKASASPAVLMEVILGIFYPARRTETPSPSVMSAAPAVPVEVPVMPAAPAVPAVMSAPRALAAVPQNAQPSYPTQDAQALRTRLQRDFFGQTDTIGKSLQKLAKDFVQATDSTRQFRAVEALRRKVGFVTHMSGMGGCYRIAQLANALEALLYKLQENTAEINDSSRKTVSDTVDFMAECLARAEQADEQCLAPTSVLIVDDDAVSNLALTYALGRANAKATTVLDPFTALKKLEFESYEVVIFDVNLPGVSGISLYQRMREMPAYQNTPVIFITGHPETKGRATGVLRPEDDWINKPVLPVELAVKVVAYALKRRFAANGR